MRGKAALAGAAGALWGAPAPAPVVPAVAALARIARTAPLRDAVALTFDDGPHPAATPRVLEVLREHRATATFFVVGEQVRRAGALLDEIRAAGHGLALHGDRHRVLLRVGPRALRDDLDRAWATVGSAALPVHRPPLGLYSLPALREVRRRGLRPLLWSRWGHDWRARATPGAIARELLEGVAAGDVLLLHDSDAYSAPGCWRSTVAALPCVLAGLEARGLRTAPLTPRP
jgi:peptidoglycan/xylan/chitin deacetylase (PgdA/CDA1 family)